jgi:hypothetical protein
VDRIVNPILLPIRSGGGLGITTPHEPRHHGIYGLVLREHLLREAVAVSGEMTYSRALEIALEDFGRRAKARKILELRGAGLWDGRLADMRRDRKAPRRRRA